MKKKAVFGVAVASAVLSCTALADGNASVKVNGNEVIYDQRPIIEDGRVLVPMRATFEALGAAIEWDDTTKTVKASNGTDNISIEIGKNELIIEGRENITLDVAAKIVNGRTLVPLRAVSEAFNADVGWDNDTKTVSIITNDGVNFIDNSQDTADESSKHDLYEEFKDENGNILYMQSCDYDKISGMTDDAVKEKIYAYLKERCEEFITTSRSQSDMNDMVEESRSFNKMVAENGGDMFYTFSSTLDYTLNEESDKYISYVGSTYTYTGGAHGIGNLMCETFDAKTGEKLTLSDITGKSEDEIRKIRTEKLSEKIKNEPEMFYEDDIIGDLSQLDDDVFDFYIKDGKVMVTLNQTYLIAPYAAGYIEFEFE